MDEIEQECQIFLCFLTSKNYVKTTEKLPTALYFLLAKLHYITWGW